MKALQKKPKKFVLIGHYILLTLSHFITSEITTIFFGGGVSLNFKVSYKCFVDKNMFIFLFFAMVLSVSLQLSISDYQLVQCEVWHTFTKKLTIMNMCTNNNQRLIWTLLNGSLLVSTWYTNHPFSSSLCKNEFVRITRNTVNTVHRDPPSKKKMHRKW